MERDINMSILSKLKRPPKDLIQSVNFRLGVLLFSFFRKFPIDNNRIIISNDGVLSDNAEALYNYLVKTGADKKYKIYWIVNNPKAYHEIEKCKFIGRDPVSVKLFYYLSTSKYYLYDHENFFEYIPRRNDQQVIYLAHGCRNKRSKPSNTKFPQNYNYVISTGKIDTLGRIELDKIERSRILELGYPRNDYLFGRNMLAKKIYTDKIRVHPYKSVLVWMPTFRQSNLSNLSEDYIHTETGLSLFSTEELFIEFNNFLMKENVLVVMKMHHLQLELPIFKKKFSNLKFLADDTILNWGIQLYQLLPFFDGLITDFSSIFVDYLLLNKPMIFTLDDFEDYCNSRSLWPDNLVDYLAGPHVYNIKELEKEIICLVNGEDNFQELREKVKKDFHKYEDSNSAKRICEYFDL